MKMTQKITGIIMAIAVLMLSTMSAFAANSETEREILSHDFNAYQIFTATGVENQYLTDVQWGSMFRTTSQRNNFLNELRTSSDFKLGGVNIFADCDTADDVARVLADYEDNSDIAKAFANCAYSYARVKFGGLYKDGDTISEAGYYLFEDASTSGVTNPVILKMAADSKVHIKVKASVPRVEKKVQENTYDVDYASQTIYAEKDGTKIPLNYGKGYNDVADYCIGDSVPFELIGTIPENYAEFDEYFYAFRDTLSKGLTYTNADKAATTVSLYDVKNGKYSYVADVTDAFVINYTVDRTGVTSLNVVCNDIISEIPKLSATSVLIVRYNATLNDDAVVGFDGNTNEVYLEYSNNPTTPTSHGETPKDKVIVFTYKLDVTKYDTSEKPLKGAEFYLLNSDGEYYSSNSTNGSYWVKNVADAELLTSDKDGIFIVRGLDKGEYVLREKSAPSGFKVLANDIEFTIDAKILPDIDDDRAQNWTTDAKDALISFAAKLDSDPDNAVIDFTTSQVSDATVFMGIVNTKVYDLPGTGGIGTTIFYIAGGVLVAAAVVLIVVKRRAK